MYRSPWNILSNFGMKQRAGRFLKKQEGGQKAGGRGGEHQYEDCSSQAGP
jgi:hypothetical protein